MTQAPTAETQDPQAPLPFIRTIRFVVKFGPPVLIAVFGGLMVWMLTNKGVGLLADSATYLQAADGLRHGHGFADFSSKIPPLYPITVALFTFVFRDTTTAARWVSILSFAATGALVTIFVTRASRSRLTGLAAGALTIATVRVLATVPWALTEPLFYALVVAALWSIYRYDQEPTWSRLIAAGVIVGLAVLTRYAGVALILTGVIVVYDRARSMRDRLQRVVVFGGIAGIGFGLWLLRNVFAGNSAVGREFIARKVQFSGPLRFAFRSMGTWLFPTKVVPLGLQQVLVLFFVVAGWFAWRASRRAAAPAARGERSLPWLMVVFFFSYLATWLITVTLLGNVNFDHRFLSPLYIAAFALSATVVAAYVRTRSASTLARAATVVVFLVVAAGAITWTTQAFTWEGGGLGYIDERWQTSATAQAVKQLPGTMIASNAPDAVYFLSERKAESLPWAYLSPGTPNPNLRSEMQELKRRFEAGDVTIVYFFRAGRPYVPSAGALVSVLPGAEMQRLQDGAIIRHRA